MDNTDAFMDMVYQKEKFEIIIFKKFSTINDFEQIGIFATSFQKIEN